MYISIYIYIYIYIRRKKSVARPRGVAPDMAGSMLPAGILHGHMTMALVGSDFFYSFRLSRMNGLLAAAAPPVSD